MRAAAGSGYRENEPSHRATSVPSHAPGQPGATHLLTLVDRHRP